MCKIGILRGHRCATGASRTTVLPRCPLSKRTEPEAAKNAPHDCAVQNPTFPAATGPSSKRPNSSTLIVSTWILRRPVQSRRGSLLKHEQSGRNPSRKTRSRCGRFGDLWAGRRAGSVGAPRKRGRSLQRGTRDGAGCARPGMQQQPGFRQQPYQDGRSGRKSADVPAEHDETAYTEHSGRSRGTRAATALIHAISPSRAGALPDIVWRAVDTEHLRHNQSNTALYPDQPAVGPEVTRFCTQMQVETARFEGNPHDQGLHPEASAPHGVCISRRLQTTPVGSFTTGANPHLVAAGYISPRRSVWDASRPERVRLQRGSSHSDTASQVPTSRSRDAS